jgi:hypothetical protein
VVERSSRHKHILETLEASTVPVKGQTLAAETGVSRQMIVKDVDELRERGYRIVSTPRGYVLDGRKSLRMVVSVKHEEKDIYEELSAIIRAGGRVIDVSVIHAVYGELKGQLNLSSIDHLNRFVSALKASDALPLLSLSKDGVHLHTIEADSEEVLGSIRNMLEERGFFAK